MSDNPLPTATIYVDGFNLYRQNLVHNPVGKWLDLWALSRLLLPTHEIKRVRYFTANVRPLKGYDPQGPIRQQTYLRALRDSGVDVHDNGQFRADPRNLPILPLTEGPDGELVKVRVRKIEEKGSDVNLASHLIFDACTDPSDVAVLVSNDSDYCTALHLLTEGLGRRFGVFSPIERPAAALLALDPLFVKPIRSAAILESQLPDPYVRKNGKMLTRPAAWA
ncbi:NYN domain-containing protein [Microbacterium sp. E-13]|uniref:NYN domain-containing protein n=1 Tax=Microbacterium sp. E-13 TaxID=3404048 RepID=UPI003CEF84E8